MRRFLFIFIAISIYAIIYGQVPTGFNYQAVARNAQGQIIANAQVTIEIAILKGGIDGSMVYDETFSPVTNSFGLVNLVIGTGTVVSGSFEDIDWGSDTYFIKLFLNSIEMGTTQLLSVPYAMHSKTADSIVGGITELDPEYTSWDKSTGITIQESQITDLQNYLTVESDPVFETSVSKGITDVDTSYWNNKLDSFIEVDPVFTTWDKSTGIAITESQITDLDHFTNADETDPVYALSVASGIKASDTTYWSSKLSNYTETDPIFEAWNKSTGIDITAIQVSDFQSAVANVPEVLANTAKRTYPSVDSLKLSGIQDGAEVNVNADWNATDGEAQILNQPVLAAVAISGNYNDLINQPKGLNYGDMEFWNGTSWIIIPVGKPGQLLHLNASSKPEWFGSSFPILTTKNVSSIKGTSAICGGTIINFGGEVVKACGVCWSTSINPTTANNKTTDSLIINEFSSLITGLISGTTYYIRSYATNNIGTAYGNEITFTTPLILSDADSNNYNTVTIGTQVWMSENLKTTKYNDGQDIPLINDDAEWANLISPGFCWLNNDSGANKMTYGALYNWYAVNTGKLCPAGWHVPSYLDWTTLKTYLGDESFVGGKLKESGTMHWNSPNYGATNESGFTGLPGSYRSYLGIFYTIGSVGYWWSSENITTSDARWWYLSANYSTIGNGGPIKSTGASVRCLRDLEATISIPTLSTLSITPISNSTVECGGDISDDGGIIITSRGVCWNTTSNPTIVDNKTIDGTGTGSFVSSITGLNSGTKYFFRSYATNSIGTAYGNEISYTTVNEIQVSDIDGNVYNTVSIGTQTWMAENLKTTKYNDNTDIPLVEDASTWGGLSTPGYCWYNNDEALNKETFGALYNRNVINTNKICPTGWHVPNNTEWNILKNFLGGAEVAGGKLKEVGTSHWIGPNIGATNEVGFTALPSGFRNDNGVFNSIGNDVHWWSASEGWYRYIWGGSDDFNEDMSMNPFGFSVRCLKD